MKGRAKGAETVSVTRNETLTALNAPDAFILAIVEVSNGSAGVPRYIRRPFAREPDVGATSLTYKLADLLARAQEPSQGAREREKRSDEQRGNRGLA